MVIGLMVGPRIAGARGHLIDPVSTFREVRVVLAIALRKHYRLWPHFRLWIVLAKQRLTPSETLVSAESSNSRATTVLLKCRRTTSPGLWAWTAQSSSI